MKYYYDKDLQDLLEKYLEAGDNGFSTTTSPTLSDLNNELFNLGYTKKQSFELQNKAVVDGLGIFSKGIGFLKNACSDYKYKK